MEHKAVARNPLSLKALVAVSARLSLPFRSTRKDSYVAFRSPNDVFVPTGLQAEPCVRRGSEQRPFAWLQKSARVLADGTRSCAVVVAVVKEAHFAALNFMTLTAASQLRTTDSWKLTMRVDQEANVSKSEAVARCYGSYSRLTDGGEAASPAHRPRPTPPKRCFLLLILTSVRG
jgi:hypothetical protein